MAVKRKRKAARKSSRIEKFHGWLCDAVTGTRVRVATSREAKAFGRKRGRVLVIDGRAVKLDRTVSRKKVSRRKKSKKKRAKKKRAKKG